MIISEKISESLTLKFAQTARKLRAQGREIISLGLGEPDFETPEYIIDDMNEAIRNGYTNYSNSAGLDELRELISEKYKNDFNYNISKNNVVIFPGAKAALYLTLAAILKPNDEVIIISPYYVSYPSLISLAEPNAKIIDVQMNGKFEIDINNIISKFNANTKCVIINFPHNPTGAIINYDSMYRLIKKCYESNIYLVSDEVYDKLIIRDNEFFSAANYSKFRDYIVIVNGYSKSYAMTGWRIGYAIVPSNIFSVIVKLNQHINTNTCTFIQKAVCSTYLHKDFHIEKYILKLEKRFNYFINLFSNNINFKIVKPKGGFFCFADISNLKIDSNTFCSKLLDETGVALTPGVAFGPHWDNYVRISLATDLELIKKGGELIKRFLDKYYG